MPKVPYGQEPDWRTSPAFARRRWPTGWSARTTRCSPGRTPTACGAISSAAGSSIRWTISARPIRRCNPELLDALTEDFIKSGFDVQHLIRTIVLSRTYQLSIESEQVERGRQDQLLPRDSAPADCRADDERGRDRHRNQDALERPSRRSPAGGSGRWNGRRHDFLKLFGRPKRETACECERTSNVSLAHALNLVNGPLISDAVDLAGQRDRQAGGPASRTIAR